MKMNSHDIEENSKGFKVLGVLTASDLSDGGSIGVQWGKFVTKGLSLCIGA